MKAEVTPCTERNFLVAVTLLVVPCFAQTRRPDPPVRQPVRGTHGAVAAGSDWATNAGMRLYDQGGTAVDAGVATMFAASVTELRTSAWAAKLPS